MAFRKVTAQEFQHQVKDIRTQLVDQVKALEQRTDVQTSILNEIQDFLKRRAEIDLEYSNQLNKLVKTVMLKYKNEKQKRANWSLYSTCSLWQQLVDDTKEEARQRGITAEVYGEHLTASISNRCLSMQKLSKECRTIGMNAQSKILRALKELQEAMKNYQMSFEKFVSVSAKLQEAQALKSKYHQDTASSGGGGGGGGSECKPSRKQRSADKHFQERRDKYEDAKLDCDKNRNEYLLCIGAANAALHRYFADDISDLIDGSDLGMEHWLNVILTQIISCRKAACKQEMNALANLASFKDSLQTKADIQKFIESSGSTFMLPKQFTFKCEPTEAVDSISADNGLFEPLQMRHRAMVRRLADLRKESDEKLGCMEEDEQRLRGNITSSLLLEITEYGIADMRPPADTIEAEFERIKREYLESFEVYLLNANLIMRLEARVGAMGVALGEGVADCSEPSNTQPEELAEWLRRKRISSRQASVFGGGGGRGGGAVNPTSQSSPPRRRARLFGGSLEEYVEATGEKIPLVVTSCIGALSRFVHHQGVFRVSGSQLEINHLREAFEQGDDPLRPPFVNGTADVNSIAGTLKLYLRELREPLFPFYLFELLTQCAKCSSVAEFIAQITPLLNKLPRPNYLLLRYLFAFLSHISTYSDENMMDAYNLAICWGPTLLPIPEGKDQVFHQNYVNEVVKNLIVHCEEVFSAKVNGPSYQKYSGGALTEDGCSALSQNVDTSNDIDLFVDDLEGYLSSGGGGGGVAPLVGTFSSSDTASARGEGASDRYHHSQQQPQMMSSAVAIGSMRNSTDVGDIRRPVSTLKGTVSETRGQWSNHTAAASAAATYRYPSSSSSSSEETSSTNAVERALATTTDSQPQPLHQFVPHLENVQQQAPQRQEPLLRSYTHYLSSPVKGLGEHNNPAAAGNGNGNGGGAEQGKGPVCEAVSKTTNENAPTIGTKPTVADSGSNYSSIAAKSERIRIAVAPGSLPHQQQYGRTMSDMGAVGAMERQGKQHPPPPPTSLSHPIYGLGSNRVPPSENGDISDALSQLLLSTASSQSKNSTGGGGGESLLSSPPNRAHSQAADTLKRNSAIRTGVVEGVVVESKMNGTGERRSAATATAAQQ